MLKLQIENSWKDHLQPEFDKEYMLKLEAFLAQEYGQGKTIYPDVQNIFACFNHTSFEKVKVVILGQDPYHGPGLAHGLSFSVQKSTKIPPSLRNIYKEISRDLSIISPPHGNLESWANQGVLLLNSVLTVEKSLAGSHQKKGWEIFTDTAISALNAGRENIVFLLWGNYAISKGQLIDETKHLILKSAHPSPLSAHRGFIGNEHFSKANNYLEKTNQTAINWSITD
ncbi:MAG: uracil-DNA glycosylase [Sneathiella sp.]|nr:uracil-DNA glycosylase [Sneathiella sp.]